MNNRYRSELLGNVRHARLSLIAGLENPRLSPVTRERMMSWISEAEDELVFRARQAGELPTLAAEKLRTPSLRDLRSGAVEPQTAHDRERLAWSFQN